MNNRTKNTYFTNILLGIRSSIVGLRLSIKHLVNAYKRRKPISVQNKNYFNQKTGLVTLRYPYEQIPVPDNGRYRLHNEMDDCIVCDKCAKICPVDCIEIEPIRATEQVGTASDGSPIRLYASKFDIDMAKCCYCGLCTTVCPTECLTMTRDFDYSETQVEDMIYGFANLSPEEAQEKMELWKIFQKEKEEAKKSKKAVPDIVEKQKPIKESGGADTDSAKPKPKFRPKMKAKKKAVPDIVEKQKPIKESGEADTDSAKPRPKFRPKMKAKKKAVPKQDKADDSEDTT